MTYNIFEGSVMKDYDNDKFNERFEHICQNEKQRKQRKKEVFEKNIKPHLVYEDEHGNIVKTPPCQDKKQRFSSRDIIILLIVIIALVKLLCMWFGYLGIL